jgi:hypothetical protein
MSQMEANTAQPEFPGAGASRQLYTQSGQKVAMLQQAMFSEGRVYTATFNVRGVEETPFAALVEITWSEGGNSVHRRFSLVNGVSITLPGRVIDIHVIDNTPSVLPISGGSTPGAGTPYWVDVVVCPGTRNQAQAPTLYEGIATLPSHASMTVVIPSHAGIISVEVCGVQSAAIPTGTPLILVSAQAGAGIFKQWVSTFIPGFVALPPMATELVITNADSANANVTITFGVDG